ncbi:hypothetical protein F4804DRAFT_340899 [Jackrogersella minutella]|nr:hypothetical protein F4804DRAFT_340899 [Jackrogersella minutella]
MPKWDKTRDYYADLELPSSATTEDVKKQFKKLALKYHPDRNPGKEAEVNPKFQTIQSAHEILIDEKLRRQYDDAHRVHLSRYPKSSGVRGNPWQDAGKQWQPPPPRPPNRPPFNNSHSGAQRYTSFASSVPRTPKATTGDDPQSRKSYADAWEKMRSNSTRRAPPTTPGRAPTSAARDSNGSTSESVPPKSAYQQQKAQASFGNSARRAGFTPHSPADEPPVTNKNYFTTRTHSTLFNDVDQDPTPATARTPTASTTTDQFAQFKGKVWDERHSTPYHTPGGEKTSLFDDGLGIGRTASTRSPKRPEMPGTFPQHRPRSSSTPKTSSNDAGSVDSTKLHKGANVTNPQTPNGNGIPQPRPTDRYRPDPGQPAFGSRPTTPLNGNRRGGSTQATNGPSVYAYPFYHFSTPSLPLYQPAEGETGKAGKKRRTGHLSRLAHPSLFYFEEMQKEDIACLVRNRAVPKHTATSGCFKQGNEHLIAKRTKLGTDCECLSSLNFSARSDGPSKGAGAERLAQPSTDSINTKFVETELPEAWKFSAGNASADDPQTPTKARPQSQPRSRSRRQVPKSRSAETDRMPSMQEGSGNATVNGFSAGEWSDKIGPQHFEPQPSRSASSSPTRRPTSRKAKPVKMTAGTAGLVDEEESEGSQEARPASSGPSQPNMDTATAMDIDTPPPEKVDATPKVFQTNGARKIPVEPHREEWRAGDVNGARTTSTSPVDGNPFKAPSAQNAAPQSTFIPPFAAQHGGSEDSEEFRTTFSDFKNVEPFVNPVPTGLKDFSDLKSTLPFQSRPSEQIPIEKEHPVKNLTLEFPHPPVAPRLPPTVVTAGIRPNQIQFRKYAQDFYQYMDKWETFNAKITAHFTTRQEHIRMRREKQGVAWLDTPSGALDYFLELEQDRLVRQQWDAALADHQAKIREFMMFKDQVN